MKLRLHNLMLVLCIAAPAPIAAQTMSTLYFTDDPSIATADRVSEILSPVWSPVSTAFIGRLRNPPASMLAGSNGLAVVVKYRDGRTFVYPEGTRVNGPANDVLLNSPYIEGVLSTGEAIILARYANSDFTRIRWGFFLAGAGGIDPFFLPGDIVDEQGRVLERISPDFDSAVPHAELSHAVVSGQSEIRIIPPFTFDQLESFRVWRVGIDRSVQLVARGAMEIPDRSGIVFGPSTPFSLLGGGSGPVLGVGLSRVGSTAAVVESGIFRVEPDGEIRTLLTTYDESNVLGDGEAFLGLSARAGQDGAEGVGIKAWIGPPGTFERRAEAIFAHSGEELVFLDRRELDVPGQFPSSRLAVPSVHGDLGVYLTLQGDTSGNTSGQPVVALQAVIDGVSHEVARSGDQAPGIPGGTFGGFGVFPSYQPGLGCTDYQPEMAAIAMDDGTVLFMDQGNGDLSRTCLGVQPPSWLWMWNPKTIRPVPLIVPGHPINTAAPGEKPVFKSPFALEFDLRRVGRVSDGRHLLVVVHFEGDSAAIVEVDLHQGCSADIDRDGVLSPADFSAWIAAFNASATECDQNNDGACTPADFSARIAGFNAGC